MDTQTVVVLVIGIATVVAQIYGARLAKRVGDDGAKVAEKQLEASAAALRQELAAVIVLIRGGYGSDKGDLTVSNVGRHPAIDMLVELESVGSTRVPVIAAGTSELAPIHFGGNVELREAFAASDHAKLTWSDGFGLRSESVPILKQS